MRNQSTRTAAKNRRRNTLRLFYVLVVAAIVVFTLGPGRRWHLELIEFLKAADTHQKLINHDATSFAFAGSLVRTLVFGLLERFGFLLGASLLLPALMIALWSIGLILFSWRYQE